MGEVRIKRDVADAIVYGFHVDPSISDPSNAVTYLEDAVGMTPASMGSTTFNSGSWADAFFMPKPCMVRYDGTVDYYLDPSDYSKKTDGTASDIADSNYGGNAMMEWGLLWFKFEPGEADGEGYFYVSNKKVNDSFNCWCNYDANNNINPHFYTAIYNGTGTDKLRSISGVQLTPANGSGNTTGQQEITCAIANNTSELTEWYIDLWADRVLLTGLLYLMGKSLNLQATFGRGLDSGGQTAKESYVTGTLNDKGLFWGVTGNGTNAVKVFGMENFWGCAWHRTAGLFGTSTGYAYKLTHGNIDGSTATKFGTTANGYISVIATQPEIGYVTKMIFGKYGMLPFATGGSTSSYYCDNYTGGPLYLITGGASYYGLGCGFAITLNTGTTAKGWYLSTSLSLKPRAKIPYNPDWDNRPAHKFTNGQWVDIPTHHYVNGRWQGELTSQSPLKFRADGEMLDWRVEGKTSENLFYGELEQGSFGPAAGQEYLTNTRVRTKKNGVLLDKGTYTVTCIGSTGGMGVYAYTTESLYVKDDSVTDWTSLPLTFTLSETRLVRFVFRKTKDAAISPSDISDIQLLEGTYTASTLPPYEPYGGVGDWDETEQKYRIPVTVNGVTTTLYTDHQLMDGDSIDYTTDQTAIPLATGNNTLTVDTAVQPKSVFVKFEG